MTAYGKTPRLSEWLGWVGSCLSALRRRMHRSGHGYGVLTRPTAGLSLSPCPSAQTLSMISATFQSADRADAAAIASLHAKSWQDAYRSILDPNFLAGPIEADRLTLWSDRLADPAPSLIVQTARGSAHQLIGFIAAFRDHDPRWGSWVDNLHVAPEMRGQKIGERLLRSMAQNLASQGTDNGLYLWVFEANQAGLRFYQRLGGKVVEHDTSRIPAASGKTILRVHWPTLSALA